MRLAAVVYINRHKAALHRSVFTQRELPLEPIPPNLILQVFPFMHELLAQSLGFCQVHWEVALAVQQLVHFGGEQAAQARSGVVPRSLLGGDFGRGDYALGRVQQEQCRDGAPPWLAGVLESERLHALPQVAT